MNSSTPKALSGLRQLTGDPSAGFREGQGEAVELLVAGGQSLICVQRTGWGKSAVYFLATHLMREEGLGPTIIVSPLLALMRNQVAAAKRLGIYAATVNSSNQEDWDVTTRDLEEGRIDVLLVSPERFGNEGFMRSAGPVLETVGLLVIDEAHCISDWGHDFRPDYRRLNSVIAQLPNSASILCTTATANDRVIADVHDQLAASDRPVTEIRGSLARESLRLEVVDLPDRERKLAWLASHIESLSGSGIVYCSTIRDTELAHSWLLECGLSADRYHGQLDAEARLEVERRLLQNEIKVLVATSALGMGYDKPDLGFVIHFQCPGSSVAYYQQVGRAGRALKSADGILLRSEEDFHIQDFFINTAIPPRTRVEELRQAFDEVDSPEATLRDLQARISLGPTRIKAMLTMLEVDGVVKRNQGGGWSLEANDWPYDNERYEDLTRLRRHELQRMRDYGNDGVCLMQFLREELDDPDASACGTCSNCTGETSRRTVDPEALWRAAKFIRGRIYEIEPRKQWMGARSGRIPEEERSEQGIAISRYADGAYGDLVREGKYEDGFFSNELIDVAAERIAEWNPEPSLSWVTAVPSLGNPELVPSFAEALAERLGLPFIAAVSKTRPTMPQKTMKNSSRQAMNVFEAFSVAQKQVLDSPVLLVDDMCDSRWTMTEIASLLREAGSGPVFPFALADSSNR
jgi:ATP-dependent DNA helicase RecQ